MSYQVIARKYRPQTFDDVVGQPAATGTLKNAILHDRVAHGYIFSGARGVGKTTSARILAKALNCVNGPTITPCGVCDSCRDIAISNSVDVIEIDAASNRGIDEIRELRETARYLPARDRNKIFIIDEAHMLTAEAFNALLKTLEEPPPHCLFILATTEAHKLPATIQSRCQHFAFRLLAYSEIVTRLKEVCAAEKIEADEESLGAIAEAASGSLRDALSLLDQVIAGCGAKLSEAEVHRLLGIVPGKFLAETVEAVIAGDGSRVLGQLRRLANEGQEPAAFLGGLTRFIRNLMIARTAGAETPLLEVPSETRANLKRLSQLALEEGWLRFFQILLQAQNELRYSLDPHFHLELALLKLVHARRLTSLEGVLAQIKELKAGTPAGQTPVTHLSAGGARSPEIPSAPARRDAGGAASAPRVAGPPNPVARASLGEAIAEDRRLTDIKNLLFARSKRIISVSLDSVAGWRFENGEVHFTYSRQGEGTFFVDTLNLKENHEALRQVCAQVFGSPVKVRVTLQERDLVPSPGVTAPAIPDARTRAASDPLVRAFEQRFDCFWESVEDLRGTKP